MEKQPYQEYRDELSEKLKEVRNNPESDSSKKDAYKYLEEQKKTTRYEVAKRLHKDEGFPILYNEIVKKSMQDGVFDTAEGIKEILPKEKLIELGDTSKKEGRLNKSLEFYKKAGAIEKLIELGDYCMELDYLYDALSAYKEVDDKKKLLEVGNRLLNKYLISQSSADKLTALQSTFEAYMKADDRDKLMEVGDIYLEWGDSKTASRAYELAGTEVPKEKMIECARLWERKGNAELAIAAYEYAGVPMGNVVRSQIFYNCSFEQNRLNNIEKTQEYLEEARRLRGI